MHACMFLHLITHHPIRGCGAHSGGTSFPKEENSQGNVAEVWSRYLGGSLF